MLHIKRYWVLKTRGKDRYKIGKQFSLPSTVELSESSLTALKEENKSLTTKVGDLEGQVKKLHQDLEEKETAVGIDGLTRIEVAQVLRERNEYKEKYLSLLEQIRCVYIIYV